MIFLISTSLVLHHFETYQGTVFKYVVIFSQTKTQAFTTLLAGAATGAQLDSRFANLQKEYNTLAPELLKLVPQQAGGPRPILDPDKQPPRS